LIVNLDQQTITLYTSIISGLTALVAVIVGPIVSVYVARRQIRASVVSANRQKWIDSLRDQLAEFITAVRVVGLHRGLDLMEKAEYDSRLQQLLQIESQVTLLLNHNEDDHRVLIETIRAMIEQLFAGDELAKRKLTADKLPTISLLSQSILKREWERVKRGD
jgi:hypothetical protein